MDNEMPGPDAPTGTDAPADPAAPAVPVSEPADGGASGGLAGTGAGRVSPICGLRTRARSAASGDGRFSRIGSGSSSPSPGAPSAAA